MTSRSQPRFARLYVHAFASAACVLPVASYVLATFRWSPADIGVGAAVLGISGTASSPFWGRLDDRTTWAPRAAVLVVAAAALAAALTLGRTPHFATWVALALFGAGEGPMDALLTTRVLSSGPHASRLGALRAFGSVGWVVGLVLAAAVLALWPGHAEWVLVVAAVTAMTSPRSWGERTSSSTVGTTAGSSSGAVARPPLPLKPIAAVLMVTLPTSIGMSALVQFSAGWARQELSAGPFLAVAPIALSALLELPVLPHVDRLARSRRPMLVAVLAGPPLTLATAILAVFPSIASILAVQGLIAISFSLLFVGQSRMLAAAVPADRQASAQTLGSALITGVGGLIAGLVGGRVADGWGYGGLMGCLSVLIALGAVVGGLTLLRACRRDNAATACPDGSASCTVTSNR